MTFFKSISPHFAVLFSIVIVLLARQSLSYQEDNMAPSRLIVEEAEGSTLPSTLPSKDALKGEKGNDKRKEVEPTLDPSIEAKKNKKPKKNEKDEIKKKKKMKKRKKKKTTMPIPSSTNLFPSIDALISLPAVSKNHPFISPEIKQGCKNADYPTECVSSMLTLGSTEFSEMSLFESSVEVLEQALEVVRTTSLKKDMGAAGKALVVCQDVYDGALSDLKDAMKAVKKSDKYKADLKLGAVITDVDTCQESIGRANLASELAQSNLVVSKLAANAISLGDAALNFNVE